MPFASAPPILLRYRCGTPLSPHSSHPIGLAQRMQRHGDDLVRRRRVQHLAAAVLSETLPRAEIPDLAISYPSPPRHELGRRAVVRVVPALKASLVVQGSRQAILAAKGEEARRRLPAIIAHKALVAKVICRTAHA